MSPEHYKTNKGFDVIDFAQAYDLNFQRGSAVKYIARAGKKDPSKEKEDLLKAIDFLTREIEKL
ncbi:DUF3310 domain-containing protein [Leeuwenhoekiella aequorea]|uniref:DUF3310 domain-containing protein n=1 Tax=Leeuwenhoekiella aequorea TaxID=283736 RepID=UPI00352FB527|tara:strand:+ start:13069 stop:13260 length:192 start_codon:yes stop_codon:yes gene_type:complete